MTGAGGESVDAVLGRVGGQAYNAIIFSNCVFRDCRFYRITFVVIENDYQNFIGNAVAGHIPFITHVPTGQGPLPIQVNPVPAQPHLVGQSPLDKNDPKSQQ
jgi:hypothetical protein